MGGRGAEEDLRLPTAVGSAAYGRRQTRGSGNNLLLLGIQKADPRACRPRRRVRSKKNPAACHHTTIDYAKYACGMPQAYLA